MRTAYTNLGAPRRGDLRDAGLAGDVGDAGVLEAELILPLERQRRPIGSTLSVPYSTVSAVGERRKGSTDIGSSMRDRSNELGEAYLSDGLEVVESSDTRCIFSTPSP